MGLENANFINELVITNPLGSESLKESDNHHRVIKKAVKGSFPNLVGACLASAAEINLLVGATGQVWTSNNDGDGSGLDSEFWAGAKKTISTVAPSGGNDGDMWFQYEP